MHITFRCDPALIDVLPKPAPARETLPDWIRTMPTKTYSTLHDQQVRTAKQCPPFVDAMSYGFTIPLPCDVQVNKGVFTWNWDLPLLAVTDHTRSPLSFHVPAQLEGTPFHNNQQVIVKFNSFWTIELEAGWSLFATHPVNREDLPFRLISGLVDADRFNDVGIFFPASWTQPDFVGVLPKGTPIAQCFAVPRAIPNLSFESFDVQRAAAYAKTTSDVLAAPGVYRKKFRAKRDHSGGE